MCLRPSPSAPRIYPNIDADGGWWDAGDYEKYVETVSYTTALMEIGVRDFPNQMGPGAPLYPPAPPNSISYAGDSGRGAPRSSDFSSEAKFGVEWLLKMWSHSPGDSCLPGGQHPGLELLRGRQPHLGRRQLRRDLQHALLPDNRVRHLDASPGRGQLPTSRGSQTLRSAYDLLYLQPSGVCFPAAACFCSVPILPAAWPPDFAVCYQLNRQQDPALANRCLKDAEEVFARADTHYADPAPSVGSGSCPSCLLTIAPFDGYPETVWDDDMELGATELYLALRSAQDETSLPSGLPNTDPNVYLEQAAQFARNYITNVYEPGYTDTLNLYDVSGLAHFELYRALKEAGDPEGLAVSQQVIRKQLLDQVDAAITQAGSDPWGFGVPWADGDTTSHGGGLSVMASEAYSLTGSARYNTYAQRWLANILGANSWGSSFIVGDGSTFPNCIQHQVANLAGALDGTAGGTPILWGAATEGPDSYTTSGVVGGMILCPANGVDTFEKFNGNSGTYDPSQTALFQDNVQSYSTTEPAIDLTSTSFLMWSWRMALQTNP